MQERKALAEIEALEAEDEVKSRCTDEPLERADRLSRVGLIDRQREDDNHN